MKYLLVPALAVLFASWTAEGANTNFTPAADTTLFELFPNHNLGLSSLAVGATASTGSRTRGLLRFDVSSIPSNAVIESATLTFAVTRTPSVGGEPSTFSVHRFLSPWNEGAGTGNTGTPASLGETTWVSQFHGSAPWLQPGASAGLNYVATPSGGVDISGVATYAIENLQADVQAWITNSTGNHGWIMISSDEATDATARRIASREDGFNPHPALLVQYSEPPAEPVPQLASATPTNGLIELRFTVPSTYCYEVEFRNSLTSGSWSALTNICAPTGDIPAVATDSRAGLQRFYRLRISGRVR